MQVRNANWEFSVSIDVGLTLINLDSIAPSLSYRLVNSENWRVFRRQGRT